MKTERLIDTSAINDIAEKVLIEKYRNTPLELELSMVNAVCMTNDREQKTGNRRQKWNLDSYVLQR